MAVDKTTAGFLVEPDEVEAVLHNLCGFHLAERDPLKRYEVLTREQVLYDALVAIIKRERGRALSELIESGVSPADVATMTNLGTRQRVARLISLTNEDNEADTAVIEVQAASRDFDERLAAVEATMDEVIGLPLSAEAIAAYEAAHPPRHSAEPEPPADPQPTTAAQPAPKAPEPRAPAQPAATPRPAGQAAPQPAVSEPTYLLPTVAAGAAKPAGSDESTWWRFGRDDGAT